MPAVVVRSASLISSALTRRVRLANPREADLTTTAGINQLREELRQRALDGLANNNYVRMVDGELVPQSGFVYDKDYKLGDVIDLGSATGESSTARVTEYIRSKDASGYTEYPTLSVIS